MRHSFKNIKDTNLKEPALETIVDGLVYLKSEARREGFNDVSDMVSKIINEIRKTDHKQVDRNIASLAPNSSGDIDLAKVIELLKSVASLDKAQIEGLKKLISIIQ